MRGGEELGGVSDCTHPHIYPKISKQEGRGKLMQMLTEVPKWNYLN